MVTLLIYQLIPKYHTTRQVLYPTFRVTDRTRHRGHKQKRRFDRLIFIILLSLEYLLSV